MKQAYWIAFCFSFMLMFSWGQDSISRNRFSPAVNLQIGYLPKTYPIAPTSPYAAISSVELFWKFNGKDKWHQYYNHPRGGVELVYAYLGNPSELGNAIGVIPCMEMTTKNETSKWRFKMGFGISYFNKPFDPVSNPNNYYIGSSFVNMTHFSFRREKRLNTKLSFLYGLSIMHSSNGHTTLPNVGLNMFTLDAGLYFSKEEKKRTYLIDTDERKWSYTFKLGLGKHEFGETEKAVGGPNYPSYHLSAYVNRSFKRIHQLQLGVVLGYYNSYYDYITSQEVYASSQRLRSSTAIAFIGHEFIFGKFGLSTQAGIYVYNPFYVKLKKLQGIWGSTSEKLEAVITNRLGLNYYPFKKANTLNDIKNQFSMGVFIKTNLAQADLFEYAMSFTF